MIAQQPPPLDCPLLALLLLSVLAAAVVTRALGMLRTPEAMDLLRSSSILTISGFSPITSRSNASWVASRKDVVVRRKHKVLNNTNFKSYLLVFLGQRRIFQCVEPFVLQQLAR